MVELICICIGVIIGSAVGTIASCLLEPVFDNIYEKKKKKF